jgi:hypothetical protein
VRRALLAVALLLAGCSDLLPGRPELRWLEPSEGAHLAGATRLLVTAPGALGVTFFAGAQPLGAGEAEGAGRYGLTWDSREQPGGPLTLRAVAEFGAGASAEAGLRVTLSSAGPAPAPELAAQVLALTNDARAEGRACGDETFGPAPPLALEPRLSRAAQKHSEDMQAARKMSHETPEGALHYPAGYSPWQRIEAEGYSYRTAAENVAWGYPSPEAVMAG